MPNFRELRKGEVRRISIPRRWMNRSGQDSSPIHSGLLLCFVGKTISDTRRTRVNQNGEDEAAAGAEAGVAAGAAARATCNVGTLRGTYLWAHNRVNARTGNPFAGAGYEYFDGNGNIRGVSTANDDGEITPLGSFKGTCTVNANCTGSSTYPGKPEFKYDLFIHPEGDMLTWVQTKPRRGVVSAVEQRVTLKRVGD